MKEHGNEFGLTELREFLMSNGGQLTRSPQVARRRQGTKGIQKLQQWVRREGRVWVLGYLFIYLLFFSVQRTSCISTASPALSIYYVFVVMDGVYRVFVVIEGIFLYTC